MPTCFRLVSLLICWESELSVRIFRHVRIWKSVNMIKCVCVQLTRNKATFKESVTVVHFEISAKGAKANQIGCGGKLWGGPLYWLVASGCPLWAIPGSHRLWHLCKIHVTSTMWEEWHLCHVHIYETPLNDLCSWGGLHSSLLVQLCF